MDWVFSTWIYGPRASSKRKNQGSVTYSIDWENEVSKIFILSLDSKRCGRFQSSRTAIDDWRTSNPKCEDNILVSSKKKFELNLFLCFALFLRYILFLYICFKVFFKRHFAWWLKQTFEFSGPYSRVRPTKWPITACILTEMRE